MKKKLRGDTLMRGATRASNKSAALWAAKTRPMYSIEMPSDSRYKGRSASNKSVPPLRKASTKMVKEAKVDSLNARSDSVTEAGFSISSLVVVLSLDGLSWILKIKAIAPIKKGRLNYSKTR